MDNYSEIDKLDILAALELSALLKKTENLSEHVLEILNEEIDELFDLLNKINSI